MTDTLARLQNDLQDRYRLERELGRPGMAKLHLARYVLHAVPPGRPYAKGAT